MKLKNPLFDWKHWLGWAFSTLALIVAFMFVPVGFMNSLLKITLLTFFVTMIVDIIKHYTKLQ